MPTYQYACTACGHELEAVQSFTDDALTTCPDCGGALRKLFGNVGVVFKGSGFYRTDSRSGGDKGSSTTKDSASSSASSAGASSSANSGSTSSSSASSSNTSPSTTSSSTTSSSSPAASSS